MTHLGALTVNLIVAGKLVCHHPISFKRQTKLSEVVNLLESFLKCHVDVSIIQDTDGMPFNPNKLADWVAEQQGGDDSVRIRFISAYCGEELKENSIHIKQQAQIQEQDIQRPIALKTQDNKRSAYLENERANQEIERDQRKRAKEECSSKIITLIEKRGIKVLTHFTRLENISSILKHGIWPVSYNGNDIKMIVNDENRNDKRKRAISTNISYPNFYNFYSFRKRNGMNAYAVILLDASILVNLDCGFTETNAADRIVRRQTDEQIRNYDRLEQLFEDENLRGFRGIADNETTNCQSEVLIFEHIPIKYIKEIHFPNFSEYTSDFMALDALGIKVEVDPKYFEFRQGWLDEPDITEETNG